MMDRLTRITSTSFLSELNPEIQQILFETQIQNLDREGKEQLFRYLKQELYNGRTSLGRPDYLVVNVGYVRKFHSDKMLNRLRNELRERDCDDALIYVGRGFQVNEDGEWTERNDKFDVYYPSILFLEEHSESEEEEGEEEEGEEGEKEGWRIHPDAKKIYQTIVNAQGEELLRHSLIFERGDYECPTSDIGKAIINTDFADYVSRYPMVEWEFEIQVDGEWKTVHYQEYEVE